MPLIGILADARPVDDTPFFVTSQKYVSAVSLAANAQPVIIPALSSCVQIEDLLRQIDGLLFPGSRSNIDPQCYGGAKPHLNAVGDKARDETVLHLLPKALSWGIPILAICRGMQELNVAQGGTLHQNLHEVPGHIDHRGNYAIPEIERYSPVHNVNVTRDGILEQLTKCKKAQVNSLHGQGIDRLGRNLVIEATADDGTIEAISTETGRGFALGVQWHPEWRVWERPFYSSLFKAFGLAARNWKAGDHKPIPTTNFAD
tara:strand:- start:1913 stop:2689 length:777 start_codon:yes stop_codon:yes gene_type:complete